MTHYLLSNNAQNLKAALSAFRSTATVEAEFGDEVVTGSVVTLAHHGSRSANPPPCLVDLSPDIVDVEAVGLSHVDLDALGGLLKVVRRFPEAPSFWALAGFVDLNGAHKVSRAGASSVDVRRLYAWWAWSEKNRQFAPRDGSVLEISAWVESAHAALIKILTNDSVLMTAGEMFAAEEAKLNRQSMVAYEDFVVVRESTQFCNHLYCTPGGEVARACVSYNPETRAVTLSLADAQPGVNCRDIALSLWGPEAGGHAGIAGGPRTGLPIEERDRAVKALRAMFAAAG